MKRRTRRNKSALNPELIDVHIARKRLLLEERLMNSRIEKSYFLPLFALLFIVAVYVPYSPLRYFLWILTIFLVLADIVYSINTYQKLKAQIRYLNHLLKEKMKGL